MLSKFERLKYQIRYKANKHRVNKRNYSSFLSFHPSLLAEYKLENNNHNNNNNKYIEYCS
jgi:hypothetical protein